MGNAKDNYHVVLEAHVTASANTSENFVYLKDIESYMNAQGVTFTSGSAGEPMTERASKVAVSASRRAYMKCLANEGFSDAAIDKEIKALKLKNIKEPPKMTDEDGFDFGAFKKRLKEKAKG